ncbi:NADP-dependent oxidoreductase [Salipaludibacillus keqinensis]|uniref:NADP-dependent oxidoreductase n=1 Tax=Salipaludibacillus keqinensis TaxID=2045207 RepID=A0A323TFJ3_9BACI|nr:NADP-dependent oxidoreductase [Salipaludibacillus keqinensis]PYZ93982.1 NADP-dependent oxidoreductase [Salipaludibacillus keqinensis]
MTTMEQIILTKRPQGAPTLENFEFRKTNIPEPSHKEVLVETHYVSVDPYMRGRMEDTKSYVEPFKLNEVLNGGVVGKVIESNSDLFNEGDFVIGHLGWQEYSVAKENELRKVDENIAPLSSYLGVLGMPGLTAYFGMREIGKPQKGETVLVSGAAGAVGMIAGQIAKLQGAKVIGIAGSDKKIDYLINKAGFDHAINYKTTKDINQSLLELCPEGIDVYFDNVGGPISEAVYPLLNTFARIPQCGAISSYNKQEDDIGPRIHTYLIKSRVLIQGFIVGDYAPKFQEASQELGRMLQDGQLIYEETVTDGFKKIPEAFLGLFKGENLGKQLIRVKR